LTRTPAPAPTLAAQDLAAGYEGYEVLHGVDLDVPAGMVTAVVGPNACGKSTLLRTLARLHAPDRGAVVLDGHDVARLPTRDVARRVGVLPQSAVVPPGMAVADLVARGRHPHQRWWAAWSAEDEAAVADALARTDLTALADRPVDALSGGQRQRAWIALVLAQRTPLLLLDEPTTFLDLAHQVEVLDLVACLNEEDDRTVVMVLHDLALAARYAHRLVAMREGRVVATGTPGEVVTEEIVAEVFGLPCRVVDDPVTGSPLVVPAAGRPVAGAAAATAHAGRTA
jgi:iron complex transport system ATP-binding protein